jgi:hypothetical protein
MNQKFVYVGHLYGGRKDKYTLGKITGLYVHIFSLDVADKTIGTTNTRIFNKSLENVATFKYLR